MKVKEVMKRAVILLPSTRKSELKKLVRKHSKSSKFLVVDKNNKFLGDIHEDDLFFMFLPSKRYEEIRTVGLGFGLENKFFAKNAKELMSKHDITCEENDDILDVAVKLAREESRSLPVLNKKGRVVGIINRSILVRHLK